MQMKNWLKNLWIEFSNHNRYKSIATVVCVVCLIFFNACQIKTFSIIDPNVRKTVPELQAEIDSFYAEQEAEDAKFEAMARARAADVNEQIQFRKYLYDSALQIASTGGFNWLNLLTSAGTLIGAGAVADNIRFRAATKKKTTETT
jgi:hypothetical protein